MRSTDIPSHVPPLSWTDADVQAEARKYTDSAARAAVKVWDCACGIDADLTAGIVNAAAEAEMTCCDLSQRILSPLELRTMIIRYQNERASVHGDYRVPESALVEALGGPHRFTVRVAGHDRLPRAVVQFVRTLQAGEWSIEEIAHSYHDESPRKAFAITATSPQGGRTVIRLHSGDSIAAEELAARDWAVYTDSTRPVLERQAAKEQCKESAGLVPSPEGLDRITAIGGVSVSIKRYT